MAQNDRTRGRNKVKIVSSAVPLDEELDRIFAARDRNSMQPTIDALLTILAEHPTDPRVLRKLGGAYDIADNGRTARSLYEQALQAGLTGDLLRR